MKKNILTIVRDLPQYLDLLKQLDQSGQYNIIAQEELSNPLSREQIDHELFDAFLDKKVYYWVDKTMAKLPRELMQVFNKNDFREQFVFNEEHFFDQIKEPLFDNLLRQFSEEIFWIEAFRQLNKQRPLDLVIVWTDVLRHTKAITFAAQQSKVPVLQLMHGGFTTYAIGHCENQVYSDRVANISPYYSDFLKFYGTDISKLAVTGRIEFDYITKNVSKKEACEKLGLDPNKPVVVFGSTWVFPSNIKYSDALKNIGFTYETFLDAFQKLQLENQDIQLFVKVHPEVRPPYTPDYYQSLADRSGIKNVTVSTENLEEALQACDLLVSFKSTICIDALLLNKQVVIPSFLEYCDHRFFEDQAFEYVRNPEDLLETLKSVLFDKKSKQAFLEKLDHSKHYLNYKNDGKAKDRILALIDEMAKK